MCFSVDFCLLALYTISISIARKNTKMSKNHETPSTELPPSEHEQAVADAAEFVREQLPVISRLTGLNVGVEVGQGWVTDLKTGDFTVDPSFFVEHNYSAKHSIYATLHELMAHVRDAIRDPVYAARQREFTSTKDRPLAEARHIFSNILTDIYGNKLTHALLPAMKDVGADIYETRLFAPEHPGEPVDYTQQEPMHLQFLYKIIRQEMIPDSNTLTRPEVDEAIKRLRDYEGSGFDVIAYLTDPGTKISGSDRFDQQLVTIWPEYDQLLELDKQEAEQKKQEQQQGSQSGEPGESSEQSEQEQNSQPQDAGENGPFEDAYRDYFENKHPEPMSEEEHDKLDKAIKDAAKEERRKQHDKTKTPEERARDREHQLNKTLREQTGHGLSEHRAYDTELAKWSNSIEHMREVFRSVLNEVVATRRGLSRRAHSDGDVLDPRRLAQTITDIKSGVPEPEAFQRYERVRGRTELIGKTDYIFAFDCSRSMTGEPAQAAAASAVIMLEALAGMERDIKDAEEQHGINLEDFDIRTGLYAFGSKAICLKEISSGLSDRERIDAYQACQTDMGATSDFLALEAIATLPAETERQRIVIVISDGISNDVIRAQNAIKKLRDSGTFVFGVALGSQKAEALYAPHAKLITNPDELPETLQTFIEETVRR